jgi:hypothetical protein
MNITASRTAFRAIVDTLGWDALLAALDKFCGFDLYSVSQDWYIYDSGNYILKAKGALGDLIVTWE